MVADFHRLAFPLVLDIENHAGGLPFYQAVHLVSVHIGDAELAVFQFWRFYGERHTVNKRVICILHLQVKLHLFLVVQFISKMHGEGIVLHLGLIDSHAVIGKGVLCDFHGGMVARKCDAEATDGGEAHIM